MVKDIKSPATKKNRRCKNKEEPTAATVTMEEGVWKEFPEDLFEPVIARLPIATIFRFRSVSRQWNSIPSSKCFAKDFAEVPQTNPWFYSISHDNLNNAAMYDPSLKKWHNPGLLLPTKLRIPISSAGGLICFLDLIGNRNLTVINPLTRSFRELPARSIQGWPRMLVGMTLHKNSVGDNGYKIMLLTSDGDHEFYDSDTEIWARGNIPPSITIPLSLNIRSQSVSINGILYFMRMRPDGIVSYDTKCGTWNQYVIPLPPNLTNCTLAESKGRIMLVGLESMNTSTCVRVWELQKMTLLWKEVDRMPSNWCLDFYGRNPTMTCLGNQGMVMLSLMARRMNRLVTCDLSSGKWQEAPSCDLSSGKWQEVPSRRRRKKLQWFACGMAFFPSVTALP